MNNFSFTSESVCAGHPDKICDAVSDAILDAVLLNDKEGRVAIETLVTENKIIIAGELTSNIKIPIEQIARTEIKRLGYTDPIYKFTHNSPIEILVHEQSPEIATGVDNSGAGDQGMMFGYATNETTELMPLPITLAHKLAEKIDQLRISKTLPYLRPDGKTQVTIDYKNGIPHKVTNIVLAVPHSEDIELSDVKNELYDKVVTPILENYGYEINIKDIILNGTGIWHIGGPSMDTGLTGRKIVVDTYGGYARVGGGCFSGKDPSKIDRSGAYATRYIAKNIVARGLADRAEMRLAYNIGAKYPLMQEVETFGTSKVSSKVLRDFVRNFLDTSVAGIINTLKLKRPIYHLSASYGHFGRDIFPWEKIT